MFILEFKYRNSGGLGDRIIGIINILNLSHKFDHDFYIKWDVNVTSFFKNNNFIKEIPKNEIKYISMFNNQGDKQFENIFDNCNISLFPNDKTFIFQSNLMTSKYLYNNPFFSSYNYEKDILNFYNNFYKEILIPSDMLITISNNLLKNLKNKLIGIQIRTSDFDFWKKLNRKDPDNYNPIKDNSKIIEIVNRLYNHINKKERDYNIYFTTDNNNVKKEMFNKFGDKILYYDKNICHIDISQNISNDDLGKLFVDQYIMSQKTNELYISDYSNFGVIIALSSSNNQNIYNIQLEKIEKKDLIYSKKKVPLII